MKNSLKKNTLKVQNTMQAGLQERSGFSFAVA